MAQISASPRKYFIQANGTPAAGGTLQIYLANTTTNAVTWFDQDGATNHQNANPLTLDAQGSCVVWMEAGKFYDWIAKDSLGNTIEDTKDISGATSAIIAPSPWVVTGITPTFVNTRTFTLVGNQTAEFHAGRRIRVQVTAGTRYATIMSSVFSSLTTVVLGFQNSTDALDSGLSAVDLGLSPADNPMDMVGKGSIIDLTGYSGADVPLAIGQLATYTLTAITNILLRIATGDNQEYEITVRNTTVSAGSTIASKANLQPNNANTAANAVVNQSPYWVSGTATPSITFGTENIIRLSEGNTLNNLTCKLSTKTLSKQVWTQFTNVDATNWYTGFVDSHWLDTTTAWTSLGTLNFQNAITGRVIVRRIM